MGFDTAVADLSLDSGVVTPHSINDMQHVPISTGTLPLAGVALTIDATGELIPYDGTKFDGVGIANLNDAIDGDLTTDTIMTFGFISVNVKTGQTPVLGSKCGIDATTGEFVTGGSIGTFIRQEQTDVWTVRIGW
jgi:hypothetical protein